MCGRKKDSAYDEVLDSSSAARSLHAFPSYLCNRLQTILVLEACTTTL